MGPKSINYSYQFSFRDRYVFPEEGNITFIECVKLQFSNFFASEKCKIINLEIKEEIIEDIIFKTLYYDIEKTSLIPSLVRTKTVNMGIELEKLLSREILSIYRLEMCYNHVEGMISYYNDTFVSDNAPEYTSKKFAGFDIISINIFKIGEYIFNEPDIFKLNCWQINISVINEYNQIDIKENKTIGGVHLMDFLKHIDESKTPIIHVNSFVYDYADIPEYDPDEESPTEYW